MIKDQRIDLRLSHNYLNSNTTNRLVHLNSLSFSSTSIPRHRMRLQLLQLLQYLRVP